MMWPPVGGWMPFSHEGNSCCLSRSDNTPTEGVQPIRGAREPRHAANRGNLLAARLWLPGRVQFPSPRPSQPAPRYPGHRPRPHSHGARYPDLHLHLDLPVLDALREPYSPRLSRQPGQVRDGALPGLRPGLLRGGVTAPARCRCGCRPLGDPARIPGLRRLARLLPDHRRPVLRLLLALWPPAPGALAARHPVAGGRHGLVGLLAVAQQPAAGLPALDRPAGLALPLLPGAGAGEPLPHPPVRAARLARRPGPAAVAAWHGGPGGAALPARLAGVLLQGSLGGAPLRALHPLAHGAPARPAGAAAGQAPQRVLLRHLPGPPDVLQPGRPARPRPAPAAVALCAGPGRGGPGGLHRLEPGRQPHGVGRAALRQAVAGGVIPDKSHCYQPLPENSEREPVAIVTGGTCTRRSPWRGAPG